MPVVRRSQAKNDGGGLHSPPVYPPGARNDHGFPTPQIEVRIEKEKKKDIVKPTIRTPKLEIFFLLAWLGEVFGACMASVYFLAGGGGGRRACRRAHSLNHLDRDCAAAHLCVGLMFDVTPGYFLQCSIFLFVFGFVLTASDAGRRRQLPKSGL